MMKWLIICLLISAFSASAATSIDDGIALFNHKEFRQSKTIFEPLAEKGSIRAMFWLGVTQFKIGEHSQAGSTLLKAAKAGNPWAMHLMVPSYNGYCDYLGWPCDESWMEKTISSWKKLSAQGDGKAMYALLRWGDKPWWSSIPILNKKKYGELVEKAVKAGGYEAAGYNAYLPLNIDKRIELLKYAVSRDYAPAMIDLYSAYKNEKNLSKDGIELLKRALNLGLGGGELDFYYEQQLPEMDTISDIQNLSDQERQLLAETYYYSLINQGLVGNLDFKPFKWVRNTDGERTSVKLFSAEEKARIEQKAKDFLGKVKPNLFFDESTSVHGLLNP